jgi:hypothetical protein
MLGGAQNATSLVRTVRAVKCTEVAKRLLKDSPRVGSNN